MTLYSDFLDALEVAGFSGEMSHELSDRVVLATDNSIYQVTPDAVIFPRTITDLATVAALLFEPRFSNAKLRPRGGGTGTNGQSLGDGLVVDCSRHMTGILELNVADGWVRVQPGVIKDSLNSFLKPYGFFFAPELSTSSRATIGGMISTDACGQGSCLYGKTSDHVLEITCVLAGGDILVTRPMDLRDLGKLSGTEQTIFSGLAKIAEQDAALIKSQFPVLSRSLTGYDLARLLTPEGSFDPTKIICGSEGTLAIIAEARLRILPIPKYVGQVNVFYEDFQSALRHAQELSSAGAASVETMDDTTLRLAQKDNIWNSVARFFPDERTKGINLVEFNGNDMQEIEKLIKNLESKLAENKNKTLGSSRAFGHEIQDINLMRKKAVGLLGRSKGPRRPIPFVEDCAVPPQHLESFISDFRAILDAEELEYGMFGHVDAGVLHVRPALDLTDPADEPLIRRITEQVEILVRRYGGLLWGEHGKGFRSEFVPEVFGPLYPRIQQIKGLFDPFNQLNPGKIAVPSSMPNATLSKIDEVTLRGQRDRQISKSSRVAWQGALTCNGNGACFGQSTNEVMCPSYKATQDRRHSPKGRAGLVREWLRQTDENGKADTVFEFDVKSALDGCLSCRACAKACPVQIDVAKFRAKFMESWYTQNSRPLSDHALARLESFLPLFQYAPALFNLITNGFGAALMRQIGLDDLPRLSSDSFKMLRQAGLETLTSQKAPDPKKTLVIIPDAFTRFFEPRVLVDFAHIARTMGFEPWLSPYLPSGKTLHVLGRLGEFDIAAKKQSSCINEIASRGYRLVGIEPAVTLTYTEDYSDYVTTCAPVLLPQEWLQENIHLLPKKDFNFSTSLMSHCTEVTFRPESRVAWTKIMERLGVRLTTPDLGCCGMAGMWGHQTQNRALSRKIFNQSWRSCLDQNNKNFVATGYSCRCQVELNAGFRPRHPLSLIREILN